MQFSWDRLQDQKKTVFEKFGTKTQKCFVRTNGKRRRRDGPTVSLGRSAATSTPLESSGLGELKNAISASQDVRKILLLSKDLIWTKTLLPRRGLSMQKVQGQRDELKERKETTEGKAARRTKERRFEEAG